jgi:hypothetical protein
MFPSRSPGPAVAVLAAWRGSQIAHRTIHKVNRVEHFIFVDLGRGYSAIGSTDSEVAFNLLD